MKSDGVFSRDEKDAVRVIKIGLGTLATFEREREERQASWLNALKVRAELQMPSACACV